jgi:hypothetical protein
LLEKSIQSVSLSTAAAFSLPLRFDGAGLSDSEVKSLMFPFVDPLTGTDFNGLDVVGVGRSRGLSGVEIWKLLFPGIGGGLGEFTVFGVIAVEGVLGREMGCGLCNGGGFRGEEKRGDDCEFDVMSVLILERLGGEPVLILGRVGGDLALILGRVGGPLVVVGAPHGADATTEEGKLSPVEEAI